MDIYRHKKTNELLLLKSRNSLVSTFYKLDENLNKIKETKSNGGNIFKRDGSLVYKVSICMNENCELLNNHLQLNLF